MERTISQVVMIVIAVIAAGLLIFFVLRTIANTAPPPSPVPTQIVPTFLLEVPLWRRSK